MRGREGVCIAREDFSLRSSPSLLLLACFSTKLKSASKAHGVNTTLIIRFLSVY